MRVCIFLCFVAVAGAVGEGCGPGENFQRCGTACERTCNRPNPTCTQQCVEGCFCLANRVRNVNTGLCVNISECPTLLRKRKRSLFNDTSCKENEEYKLCEKCYKSCDNPQPSCSEQCERGCFCKDGLVRDRDGQCVALDQCPPNNGSEGCGPGEKFERCGTACERTCNRPNPTCTQQCVEALLMKRKRSLFNDPSCKENEEFKLCETCYKSCDNPQPSCSEQCERGCFCKDGLVRDRDGRCVALDQCSPNNGTPGHAQACGPHKVFVKCKLCEKSCSNPLPHCAGPCRAGCFCEEGYLKHPNGQCVKSHECPKEVTLIGGQEPSVEDCGSDEEFLSCGWCEPSCSEPAPRCPPGVCTRGCLCRPPLLRHYSGQCVRETDCLLHSCLDPSEEYVCRYGCEPRCDNRTCVARGRRCVLGCHCRLGLRRHADGRCVSPEQCSRSHRLTHSHALNLLKDKLKTNDILKI